MALEAIAAQIEDPFGLEENDLALNAMCETIESALHDMAADAGFERAPTPQRVAREFIVE
jgi:putative membrane protein